ncbi:putative MFS transporter [Venturia nashicola]|uniref:Putative MFS transporter n=1 Tax=Venturia nashicola TaxID=86259 RepID=A0A4Z1PBI1_9PEZI|nr:putative MFS transporter [Venturia nashicola]
MSIVTALYLTLFIAALDQTIISTAIPTITSSLHSASGYTWIGGAYLIANAASGPIWTKLSDIWGRKVMLLGCTGWFFCASAVCGWARSMRGLVVGRALQGVAGGGCVQLVTVTISDLFGMRKRSLMLGMMEGVWAVAGGAGPVLGGVFSEKLSWRWIFWLNLPISGSIFILLLLFLDVHNPKTALMDGIKAIDWLGSLSILAVTVMILLGLDFGGETFPWNSPKVICLLVFGGVMIAFFIFSEKRLARYPLMPSSVFTGKGNVAALVVTACHGMVYIGGDYYLPLFFQSTHSTGPIISGLLILPYIAMEAIMGVFCGVITHRYGAYKELIWAGCFLMTLGTGLYIALNATSSIGMILGFEFIAGTGSGLLFQPPLVAIQVLAAQKDVATASATLGFVRNLATSIGVVVGGIIFQNSMATRTPLLRSANLSPENLERFSGADAAANVAFIDDIENAGQKMVVKQAFAWSMRNMWIFYACVGAISVVASMFIKREVLHRGEHIETKTGIAEMREKGGEGEVAMKTVTR